MKKVLFLIGVVAMMFMVAAGLSCGGGETISGSDTYGSDTSLGDYHVPDNFIPPDTPPENSELVTLTINSNPTGADITLDGEYTGKQTPSEIQVTFGIHSILLEKDEWVHYQEIEVTTENSNIQANLTYDLTGEWTSQPNGQELLKVTIRFEPPSPKCPDTWIRTVFDPFGTICVESDLSLSLCKNHSTAEECLLMSAVIEEGKILNDGTRIEFIVFWQPSNTPQLFVFEKKTP